MANWGALAAGIGAGYLAAEGWKKKKSKDKLGEGDVAEGTKANTGLEEARDYEAGYGDGGYANGGLVGAGRWYGKKPPK